jgi:uncharacterized protein (DUF2235 family)
LARNHIICCDGTDNQFGSNNTNVVRLIQVLNRNPDAQRMYYDPGVGTLPEPGWITSAGAKISEVLGLAFGAGLPWKVQEAYTYLMNHWELGDQVFLFGFSRGAYTARVLAGLLYELGLLPAGNENLVPYAIRLFKTAKKDHESGVDPNNKSRYWKLRDEFRETFSRFVPDHADRRFPVHFLGLWDTVSSVGWVWDPPKFPYSTHNPGVSVVRHAVSIDERRWFFRQNLVGEIPNQDLKQFWFAGVHCDVGGGYPVNESGLWKLAFEWIITEAVNAGLLIDPQRFQDLLTSNPVSPTPWKDPQHESLKWYWWPLEFFPKLCYDEKLGHRVPQIGLGHHRTIKPGQRIHRSALLRIRETNYLPPNLPPQFVTTVRALTDVPESLAVE